MTPRRGELADLEFDARGRLRVPEAVMAVYIMARDTQTALDKGAERMSRIEAKLDGRPCISQQGPCPTQQAVELPDATDAAIGRATRKTLGALWTATPHLWRTAIVGGGGAACGVLLSYAKPALFWLAQHL